MPDWSVKIEGKPAVFTPDIDGTPSGQPLKVVQGDLVSWNNTTDQEHWPAPDDPDTHGSFMTTPVKPDSASTAYNIIAQAGTTISYHCAMHPDERGMLVVVNFGEN
jgi:plastocyanin